MRVVVDMVADKVVDMVVEVVDCSSVEDNCFVVVGCSCFVVDR